MSEVMPSIEVLFYTAKRAAVATLGLEAGDRIIITGGSVIGQSGTTNTIRIETV